MGQCYNHQGMPPEQGFLDSSHENIQVDPQELEQYLCPESKPCGHLAVSTPDHLHHDTNKRTAADNNTATLSPACPSELILKPAGEPGLYLDAGPLVNVDPDELPSALCSLQAAASNFLETLGWNKKLMSEEKSGERMVSAAPWCAFTMQHLTIYHD